MLKFLAREQSNVDKIESLKRKTRDVHSSLKRVQLARAAIEAEQYVAKAPIANRGNNLVGIFDRGEVLGVLDCLVNELEQKFEIETVVTKPLQRIISKLEMLDPNFQRNQATKKTKVTTVRYCGRQTKPTLSWDQKANIVYFHLHPNFANRQTDLTCAVFDIKDSTLRGWLTNPGFVRKWLPAVRMLTPTDVQNSLPVKPVNVWQPQ